jgi:ABC-2 type transport system ATP-binding protein
MITQKDFYSSGIEVTQGADTNPLDPVVLDNTIVVEAVSKSFGSVEAVKNISLTIGRGEVFGLVGPNGAGKTTLIRMIMNIFRPDAGSIRILGRAITPQDKDRIGYLPEERGVYTKQKLQFVLEYFAQLKGLSRAEARSNAERWLKRLELWEMRGRQVQELSKGNQQKVQLISAIIADPEIVILDEPFSGLDPVNARLLMAIVRELAAEGKTILFSSHQMSVVESLCHRVLMIYKGEPVLYGSIDEIRRSHSDNTVIVQTDADLSECHLVVNSMPHQQARKVRLRPGTRAEDLLLWLMWRGASVKFFEQLPMKLEEIYVKIVEGNQ